MVFSVAGPVIDSLLMVMLLLHLLCLYKYLISGLPQEVSTNCNTQ